ncbi:MAG: hypothetical protein KAS32_01680 [Candidatus Peribacteraceae bacterium]|nr:hypothetical protein [Candidatus Peribacteraceae bacterium]
MDKLLSAEVIGTEKDGEKKVWVTFALKGTTETLRLAYYGDLGKQPKVGDILKVTIEFE